jgi:thiamine-phosphate pyrophosphorylase
LKKYLITSRDFYTDTLEVFRKKVHNQFTKHMPTHALYRDKENPAYAVQALHFVDVCSRFKSIKSFIHQDIDLAKELNAVGVHLTSQQFDDISYAKDLGLEVIISTHTHEEVLKAQKLGADAATYSPIFASPGKGEPKGIDDLNELLEKCDINVFALGGIIEDLHVKKLEETKVFGFASIRYFY